MYFLKNKEQLNNIILELRNSISAKHGSSPKAQKFRELVATCMDYESFLPVDCIRYNSYAALITNLNSNQQFYLEDHDENFHVRLSSALTSQPYGYPTDKDEILCFYRKAVEQYASWDEEAEYHSIIMASESL